MNPIQGPFYEWHTSNPYIYDHRAVFKQAKPFNLPLPYGRVVQTGEATWSTHYSYDDGTSWETSGVGPILTFRPDNQAKSSLCLNAAQSTAFERLRSRIADTSSWGETLAQIDKSRQLLNDSLVRIATGVNALRRGDFSRASKAFLTTRPASTSVRKSVAENLLAYEYAVKPLISDCESSLKFLSSDLGERHLHGKGHHAERTTVSTRDSAAGGNRVSVLRDVIDVSCKVRLGCTVSVSNPNLYLWTSLGLIDISLPWKLIPLSFIVDWFVNVEQWIGASSAFYGLNVSRTSTTTFYQGTRYHYTYDYERLVGVYSAVSESTENQKSIVINRAPGIDFPGLHIRPFKGLSLNRGAQAVALILSVFGR